MVNPPGETICGGRPKYHGLNSRRFKVIVFFSSVHLHFCLSLGKGSAVIIHVGPNIGKMNITIIIREKKMEKDGKIRTFNWLCHDLPDKYADTTIETLAILRGQRSFNNHHTFYRTITEYTCLWMTHDVLFKYSSFLSAHGCDNPCNASRPWNCLC